MKHDPITYNAHLHARTAAEELLRVYECAIRGERISEARLHDAKDSLVKALASVELIKTGGK